MSPKRVEPVITADELWAEVDRVVASAGVESDMGRPGPEWFTAVEFAAKRSLTEGTARDHLKIYVNKGIMTSRMVVMPNARGSAVKTTVYCLNK